MTSKPFSCTFCPGLANYLLGHILEVCWPPDVRGGLGIVSLGGAWHRLPGVAWGLGEGVIKSSRSLERAERGSTPSRAPPFSKIVRDVAAGEGHSPRPGVVRVPTPPSSIRDVAAGERHSRRPGVSARTHPTPSLTNFILSGARR